MNNHDVQNFYDALSDDYHLIFADWQRATDRQGEAIHTLIQEKQPGQPAAIRVLDCACGIGTQALGLAKRGYAVHATDLSPRSIEQATHYAQEMNIPLTTDVADMRTLSQTITGQYDVVIALDNALPHLLTDAELAQAATELFTVTRPGGMMMASIRDYDALLNDRPRLTSQRIFGQGQDRRITFQAWEWQDDLYTVTQFIVVQAHGDWQMRHYTTRYRALRRETLAAALQVAGFRDIEWVMPDDGAYYQPLVVARHPA